MTVSLTLPWFSRLILLQPLGEMQANNNPPVPISPEQQILCKGIFLRKILGEGKRSRCMCQTIVQGILGTVRLLGVVSWHLQFFGSKLTEEEVAASSNLNLERVNSVGTK